MNNPVMTGVDVLIHDGLQEFSRKLRNTFIGQIPPNVASSVLKGTYILRGFRAVGNPLRIYHVNPRMIKYSVNSNVLDKTYPTLFGIVDGEWDKDAIRIKYTESVFYEHFEKGVSWEETEFYNKVSRKIKTGKGHGGLDIPSDEQTIEDFHNYLKYLENLYDKMTKDGYKSQTELASEDDFMGRKIHPALNEIQLFIGRNGKMAVRSGRHRLYMAKVLNIPSVPVRTRIRHPGWQHIREDLKKASSLQNVDVQMQKYINHPELGDIIPEDWRAKYEK